jgi:3-oxoacyl-(acyl-carrier-protein) synthase III
MSAPGRASAVRFRSRIAGTSSFGPGRVVTTAELAARVTPPRNPATTEQRTGIALRHFADGETPAAALGAAALRQALDVAGLTADALERIVFVSSLGGDMTSPATANLVAASLGLRGSCDCFDLNNACMGFLTAFDVAARSIATGSGPIGIVVVELTSRFIAPEDPRPFLIFGDGVAAAVLVPSDRDEGVLGVWLRNDGIAFGNVRVAHGGLTGRRERIRFTAASERMSDEVVEAITHGASEVLAQAGLRLADVEWILPHQPNGPLLDQITQALGIGPERVVRVVHEIGSVGAASIPTSLDRLLQSGRLRAGERILMVGVGGGLSSGAVLIQVGAPAAARVGTAPSGAGHAVSS